MTLSELIAHIGDAHIEVQYLEENFIAADRKGKNARITFATDPNKIDAMHRGEEKHICMILWLPKDRLPRPAEKTNEERLSDVHGHGKV